MAMTPGDKQRSRLVIAVLITSAMAVFAVRSIKAGRLLAAQPVPAEDLQSLSPFLKPLTNGSIGITGSASAMMVTRDPFASTGIARTGSTRTPIGAPVPAAGGQRWVVSTILLEGSRRSAIINDAWVTVGDSLSGGSRLTAVERDHIVVTDANGVRHKVPIQGGESW